MLTELMNQEGKFIETILKIYDDNNKIKRLILSFNEISLLNQEYDDENHQEFITNFTNVKDKQFFILDKKQTIDYRTLTKEETEEITARKGTILSEISFTVISKIQKSENELILENIDGKQLAIDLDNLKVREEKDLFRIMRGMTITTKKTLSWDDIRSTGTSMFQRMMNAIVGKKVTFSNMLLKEDFYEGDILEVTYKNSQTFSGMLLYNYKKNEYVLKNEIEEKSIDYSKKSIRKIEVVRTFFDVQTSQEMFNYFNHEEIMLIQQSIMNYQAVSLGIGSLLSLVFNNEEDSISFYENVILNGIDATITQEYLNELFENQPIQFIEGIPTVAFLMPYE